MSIVDISLDLENIPDQALQQLGQGGDARYPQYLVLAEVQRRKDMRDRFQAQQAKQQAANPPSIAEQRMAEAAQAGGGIPSADPNMQGPDPSLQTGIAGPPQGGPPPMAGGGMIPGYQFGGGIGDDVDARIADLTRRKIIEEAGETPKAEYGTARRPAWRPGPVPPLVQQMLDSDPEYRAQYEVDKEEGEAKMSVAEAGGYAQKQNNWAWA